MRRDVVKSSNVKNIVGIFIAKYYVSNENKNVLISISFSKNLNFKFFVQFLHIFLFIISPVPCSHKHPKLRNPKCRPPAGCSPQLRGRRGEAVPACLLSGDRSAPLQSSDLRPPSYSRPPRRSGEVGWPGWSGGTPHSRYDHQSTGRSSPPSCCHSEDTDSAG